MRFSSLIDKSGTLGAIVAAMGCASCFTAIAALCASVGLGFLGHYEGLFINTLLPVYAGIALGANILSFFSHRIWYRLLAGIAGPSMVLATLYLFWTDNWSTYLFYAGLAVMLAVSIWDIVSPPRSKHSIHSPGFPRSSLFPVEKHKLKRRAKLTRANC